MPEPQKSEIHEVTDVASTSPAQDKGRTPREIKDDPELHVNLDKNKHDEDFGGPLDLDRPDATEKKSKK